MKSLTPMIQRSWNFHLLVGLCIAIVLTAACDRGTEQTPQVMQEEPAQPLEREHQYSPFLITLKEGSSIFKTISFTDVGQQSLAKSGDNQLILEAIAESLAYHLVDDHRLDFTPEVVYDQSLTDSSKHQFCAEHHLYVALWRSESPERWGYSLWSGCSEEHQFAWHEVPVPTLEKDDLVTAVEPLTDSITESLAKAVQQSCYLKKC